MEIERDIAYLDDDDKQFILEMVEDGVIADILKPISLRDFANTWYERGYDDGKE